MDSNESTTISTPTETEIESSPNIPLASVANDTPTATNEMNVDTTNDPDPKDKSKSLENTPEKAVNNENDNVETADKEANRNDTQENYEKSSDDKVVENSGNETAEDNDIMLFQERSFTRQISIYSQMPTQRNNNKLLTPL